MVWLDVSTDRLCMAVHCLLLFNSCFLRNKKINFLVHTFNERSEIG